MAKERRFKIGDNPRNLVPLGGSTLTGGTWYTPEMIGMTESSLKGYPEIIWEGTKEKQVVKPKVEEKKEEVPLKLTKEEFYALTRPNQKKILRELEVKIARNDKEEDLWNKYK